MKTIEEKAKAYDSIIEKANKMHSENCEVCKACIEELIPEFAESEDERIVKELLTFFRESMHGGHILTNKEYDSWIAWLEKQAEQIDIANKEYWRGYREGKKEILDKYAEIEKQNGQDILEDAVLDGNEGGLIAETIRYKNEKQGEQKPADKVEPKFKVGDWLINPRTSHIIHIKDVLIYDNKGIYELENSSMSIKNVEDNFRLWTIQDAKDGDVLYINNTVSESIIIYKSFNNRLIKKYASYNKFGFEGEHYLTLNDGYIVPATKEQCDLLFRKMKEAGYEWDAEKKELKKINSYCQENCKGFQETGKCFADGECKAKKEAEQKPEENKGNLEGISPNSAWSEEDETNLTNTIIMLKEGASHHFLNSSIVPCVNWLISLKDRVGCKANCTTTKEWSEEEIEKAAQEWESKAKFNPFYMTMEGGKPTGVKQSITTHKESFKAGVNWILKSLQDRVQSKQEWSDVDKDILSRITDDLKFLRDTVSIDPKYAVSIIDMEREITWLNSLRPQNKWKPSDEQMEALDWQVENTSVSSWQYKATKELMEDLKKLKEE